MRMIVLLGLALAACGPSQTEMRRAHDAQYATTAMVVIDAVKEVLGRYPPVSERGRVVTTDWVWMRESGSTMRQSEESQAREGQLDWHAVRFSARIVGPNAGPLSVVVEAELQTRESSMRLNEKQTELPAWLLARRDHIAMEIYRRLDQYETHGVPSVPPAPDPVVPAPIPAPIDAAPPSPPIDEPRPPTAVLEGIVVAGELDAAKVSELLSTATPKLAECLSSTGPTTTELSLSIVKSAIGLRNAWQNDAPVTPECLKALFPGGEPRSSSERTTTVYVVVKATPPGTTAPEAPKLAERRAEFVRLFCDLEKLAGAEKIDVPDKQKVMIAWARDHVKHPGPLQVAADVPTWSPAERSSKLERAIKAEGIKKCAMQRW